MRAGMPWDWVTFPEFLDSVDRTPKGVNVMSFVPLAPLYAYVAGVDNAKAYRVTDEQLDEMCRLLVEGMEAGGCGFSAQISGEVGNVQLDYDGTPMVTDCMTEREVIAFSRAMGSLGRGVAQLTGTLETAALMARESGRPIIWNALLADGALNQHGGAKYSHRDALKQLAYLNEEEGLRVFAQALTTNFVSEFTLEDYNLADTIPCWKEACLGTVEEKMVKFADPARRAAMKEIHEERGGLFGAGYDLTEIKIHWISSDVPDAQELKETYEGFTVGEIAAREGKHEIDAFLDVAVAGQLRVGFATPMMVTPPESMKEIATSPVALPGVSDGGAHTKFVTTARYPTELLGYWVREHEIMSLEEAHWRLSYYPAVAAGLKGRGLPGRGSAGRRHRLRPRDPRQHAAGAGVGLPGRRVAPDPKGRRLRPHHRQRRDHLHRRRVHRGTPRASCSATAPTEEEIHALPPNPRYETVFDADNHYWEVSDAFTRYRDPKFADRGVVLKEVDGKPRYFFGERPHPIIPGPGDVHPRPVPARSTTTSRGRAARSGSATSWPARTPPRIPSGSTATPAWPAWTIRASRRPGCSRRRASAWRARCSPTSRPPSRCCGPSTAGSRRTGASPIRTGSSASRS